MVNALRDSDTKFLLLLDGFDELTQPINLYDVNKLEEWDDDIKTIITSRHDYLAQFADYDNFFIPNEDENGFVEYIISEVDD